MDLSEGIAKLEQRRARALEMGGEKRLERQRELGKLNVRERVAMLLDDGSFEEYGQLTSHVSVHAQQTDEVTPADGVVSGFGKIAGRFAAVIAEDFTVKGGSHGVVNARKKLHMVQMARRERVPMVWLLDGAGARGQELMNDGLPDVTHFLEIARLSGISPQVSVVLGPCAGDAALVGAATEFIVMRAGTGMMAAGGPPVVKAATGQEVSKEELGGAEIHAKVSGIVDRVAQTDEEALELTRRFLSYLPTNAWAYPPATEPRDPAPVNLEAVLPSRPRAPFDVQKVILGLVDADSFFEIKPDYARMLVTGLARIDGHPVGVIANQPMVFAGAITAAAARKARRFIDLCSAYHIPLVFLQDVPGVMTGPAAEKEGTLREGLAVVYALAWADVPKVTVVLRKAFGFGACAMGGWGGEQSLVVAWPTADFASLPVSGGVAAAFKEEIASSPDPAARQREIEASFKDGTDPFNAAARFTVHDVIAPNETRARIRRALELARSRRTQQPSPTMRHGVMP
ncbi:acyl-CoA carboxylase subunit beta [Quisquiliibacterium transsilvanicum]|uniref:Acetyl-CoA carboxylase carboxyltransferase component n=1 Tax=Quisquiliibacterium transsilvanicum TaxID=1549638 RepID=A0A7W8HGS0_9BURK|nr:carboxyl transferase domain-containing protein [Quisquiliibacterium transsilvanicum]MBB5271700.1 acetyl-CoA carboxylase carboxyltransferase component [Quisquiliibacterium transsilvanicum]